MITDRGRVRLSFHILLFNMITDMIRLLLAITTDMIRLLFAITTDTITLLFPLVLNQELTVLSVLFPVINHVITVPTLMFWHLTSTFIVSLILPLSVTMIIIHVMIIILIKLIILNSRPTDKYDDGKWNGHLAYIESLMVKS